MSEESLQEQSIVGAQQGYKEPPAWAQMAGRAERPAPPMFEMVGDLTKLFAALCQAQGVFPEIAKQNTADAGKYKYDYADLADVLKAVRPGLSAAGLCLMQPIDGGSEKGYTIRTILAHTSGAYISSRVVVPFFADSQEFGKKVTYSRRYSVLSMLSIFPGGEDDDANGPGVTVERRPQAARQAPPAAPAKKAAHLDANGNLDPNFRPAMAAPKAQPVATPDPPKVAASAPSGPSPEVGAGVWVDPPKAPESLLGQNGRSVPNAGPISPEQEKELTALMHAKAWPGSDGKPFREKNPKTGAERWAIVNTSRANELIGRVCSPGTTLAKIETHADAFALLNALRDFPDMPGAQ